MVSELKDNKHKELKRIAKQWNEQNESTNKWIQIIKSNHILQMKTTMTEMKNSLAGINSGCEQAEEERISKLKDRIIEIIQSKVQGKKEWKKKKNEQSSKDVWNTKSTSTCIIQREKDRRKYFKKD